MKIIPFAHAAQKVVKEVAQVKSGENVLILSDTEVSERIPIVLASSVHSLGGIPCILIMLPPEYPGAPIPAPVEKAVQGAEVVFMATSKSVAHTEVFSRSKSERRLISMPGILEESFTEGAGTTDLPALKEMTEKVAQALEGHRRFELRSDKGTNASFLCRGKTILCYSRPPIPTGFTMFPDGEVIMTIEEKSLEGKIVMDVFQTGVGPLREPIVFTLRGGRATQIEGGIEAHLLQEFLEKYGDENAYYFGEFALGTNPKARFIGSAGEDKKRLGSVHLSLGDDIALGGELKSKLHLDGVIGRPTLRVDGKTLIEDGKLRF